MSGLVNQLLNLAKMENEEEKIVNHKINLSELVEKTILSMEALGFEKQIEIKKEIQEKLILTQNEERIKQILQIVLDNAFKYTNQKGIIKVNLKKEGKQIKLKIENTGIGIKKEDLPHIFDRFYQADKARSNFVHSYGLGLSIAKIAAEKIGGKIIAESIPNEITVFTLVLED